MFAQYIQTAKPTINQMDLFNDRPIHYKIKVNRETTEWHKPLNFPWTVLLFLHAAVCGPPNNAAAVSCLV